MKATRYLGTCGCCEQVLKVQKNLLVLHGYLRPGDGRAHGRCFGYNRPPHELSPEVAQDFKALCERSVLDTQQAIESLPTLTEISLLRRNRAYELETVTYHQGMPGFEGALAQKRAELQFRLQSHQGNVLRMAALLKDWAPKALTSWEDDVQHQAALRAARAATKAAEKAKKLHAKVQRYQERIDSAVRRKTFSVLVDIFQDGPSKLRDLDRTLDREAALTLLDRNQVWQRFGLRSTKLSFEDACRLKALKDWPTDQAEK